MNGLFDGDTLPAGYGETPMQGGSTPAPSPGHPVAAGPVPGMYRPPGQNVSPTLPGPGTQAAAYQNSQNLPWGAAPVGPIGAPFSGQGGWVYQMLSNGSILIAKAPAGYSPGKILTPGTTAYTFVIAEMKGQPRPAGAAPAAAAAATADPRVPVLPGLLSAVASGLAAGLAPRQPVLAPGGAAPPVQPPAFQSSMVSAPPSVAPDGMPMWQMVGLGVVGLVVIGGAVYYFTSAPAKEKAA